MCVGQCSWVSAVLQVATVIVRQSAECCSFRFPIFAFHRCSSVQIGCVAVVALCTVASLAPGNRSSRIAGCIGSWVTVLPQLARNMGPKFPPEFGQLELPDGIPVAVLSVPSEKRCSGSVVLKPSIVVVPCIVVAVPMRLAGLGSKCRRLVRATPILRGFE